MPPSGVDKSIQDTRDTDELENWILNTEWMYNDATRIARRALLSGGIDFAADSIVLWAKHHGIHEIAKVNIRNIRWHQVVQALLDLE